MKITDYTKKNKNRLSFKMRAIIFIVVFFSVFYFADHQIRPVIYQFAELQTRLISVMAINEAVLQQIDLNEEQFDKLIKIEYLSDGTVASVKMDANAANNIKENLLTQVNKNLTDLNLKNVEVPLGTLLENSFFNGVGPNIKIKIVPVSYAAGELSTNFETAGYNQTLYKVSIKITVEMQAIIPGYIKKSVVQNETVLAQTVIVGHVPQIYSGVY